MRSEHIPNSRGSGLKDWFKRRNSKTDAECQDPILPLSNVFRTWWPLAASWILMAFELPALSAVVARLPSPETNLAAWGGVVFPVSMLIEAPIIMLLAVSTALSKDWGSYQQLRRFMMVMGASLTLLHFLISFTPLFDLIVVGLINPPAEIVEPARIGLQLMLPWTWSIAYRRFNQGVLIRFGHTKVVGWGTLVRLITDGLVLALGYWIGTIPGIAVAGVAVSCGVLSEALYAGLRVRPVLDNQVKLATPVPDGVTVRSFLDYYFPLVMTSLLTMMIQPLGSAALSRMPEALASLAVWPVLSGLVFLLRSLGVAYNEVVVALLDKPKSYPSLKRFTFYLVFLTTSFMILVGCTPLSKVWFVWISALNPKLASLGATALWFALPLPALNAVQSLFQGILLYLRQTRSITISVAAFLLVAGVVLWVGVMRGEVIGLYLGWSAFSIGAIVQTIFLWQFSRSALSRLSKDEGA